MPYVKFDTPKGSSSNTLSCCTYINYLSKEDFSDKQNPFAKEFLFNHSSKLIPDYIAIEAIDNNRRGLKKGSAIFYTGSINFSEEELKYINNDFAKIKECTIKIMENYAQNFNKGLTIYDLNWFAKIEKNRYYKGSDPEVVSGTKKQGDVKDGLNTHVHFIVGHLSLNGSKISPKTNHRNTKNGPVKGGFNRDEFFTQCETTFDQMFGYLRNYEESYEYHKVKKNGSVNEKNVQGRKFGNDLKRRETYSSQSIEQKERRIRNLANYICFGKNKKNVKYLNVDALILQERMSGYSGYVYRSLVNLNREFKQGKISSEYDQTDRVMDFAFYLESKESKTIEVKEVVKPIAIVNESTTEVNISTNMNYTDPVSHSGNKDDLDAIDLLRRKKKGKKKNRDMDKGWELGY